VELVALKPLALETLVFRTTEGAFHLAVIARATFDLKSGELLDPEPVRGDVLHQGGRSLRVASDLVPRRARADVTFAGHAHRERVRFTVIPSDGAPLVDKTLRVSKPPIEMSYEHAFGGASSKTNPVGTATPRIVDPANEKRTGGLGPVPSTWWWRSRLLGDHDLATIEGLRAIPRDLDFAFFNAAPPDQQVAFLKGNETILLEGLTTDAELRVTLPGLRAFARVEIASIPRDLTMVCDALVVDGDSLRATLTFRGDMPIPIEHVEARVLATLAHDRPEFPAPARSSKRTATHPSRTTEHVPVINQSGMVPFTIMSRMRRDALVVVVKGTFDLVAEAPATLAARQEPPRGDTPWADGESLRYASDFAPFKPRADVTLVGHGYPGDDPTVAHVHLHFGELRRSVAVFGDRKWETLGAQGKPATFKSMPLRWERAFGGADSSKNPYGRGKLMLPNLERLDALMQSPDDNPEPAVFAPLDASLRRASTGTYGARWLETRWPYFPDDFDWAYFNAAPREQQIDYPRGDERYALFGVIAGGGRLQGRMPAVRPRAFAALVDGRFTEIALRIDTVHFDADARQLIVVHRGLFETNDPDASEVAAVFVVSEDGKALPLEEAHERYLAEATVKPPEPYKPPPIEIRAPPPKRKVIEGWFREGTLVGRDLTGGDLRDLDLAGVDLRGTVLARCDLRGAKLRGANLDEVSLSGVRADDVDFTGATLLRADLHGAVLDGARFDDAKLASADLRDTSCSRARFKGATLDGAQLDRARCEGALFERTSMRKANLTGASLNRAVFVEANLDDAKLYDVRGSEVKFDRASMNDARLDRAFLPHASFPAIVGEGLCAESADFERATFQSAKLKGALFVRARLREAILSKADLRDAILRKADLHSAKLLRTNAMGANFVEAGLERADFRGANLYRADTWRARVAGASFEHAHLVGTKLSG
jgi:uncharacterized protein YjbI with pentapeptide repeats